MFHDSLLQLEVRCSFKVEAMVGISILITHLNNLVLWVDELDMGNGHANWITLRIRLHIHRHVHRSCEDCTNFLTIFLEQ